MRIKETKVYKYDELSDHAKEKARDWYRQTNSDDNYWSEAVIEDATHIALLLGMQKGVKFYWSGFSHQGSGAQFIGQWYASDCKPDQARAHAPQDDKLAGIISEWKDFIARFPESSFTVKAGSYGEHEMATRFDIRLGTDENECDITNDKAEEEITEIARDFMRWTYRQLEKEYDWINDDAQVEESIQANDYEFDEDGSLA